MNEKKLWCDLETDKEKCRFLRSGRAHNTGIIAHAIVDEVADHFDESMFISKKQVFEIVDTCFHALASHHRTDAKNIVEKILRS